MAFWSVKNGRLVKKFSSLAVVQSVQPLYIRVSVKTARGRDQFFDIPRVLNPARSVLDRVAPRPRTIPLDRLGIDPSDPRIRAVYLGLSAAQQELARLAAAGEATTNKIHAIVRSQAIRSKSQGDREMSALELANAIVLGRNHLGRMSREDLAEITAAPGSSILDTLDTN